MKTLEWANVVDLLTLNRQMRQLVVTIRRFSPKQCYHFFLEDVPSKHIEETLGIGMGSIDEYLVLRASHLYGIGVYSNDPRTAGTLTVEPTINGVVIPYAAVLDATNPQTAITRIPREVAAFIAEGDRLGAVYSTDINWLPVTADIIVTVMTEFTMED